MLLRDYQRVAALYSEEQDEITNVALLICDLFNKSHEEVNNFSKVKFLWYTWRITRKFNKVEKRPWWSWLKFETDATKITFGQFIETQHFVKLGEIDSINLVAATILKGKKQHNRKADFLLKCDVRHSLWAVKTYLESFQKLVESYAGLFETDSEVDTMEKPHPFVEQYGWIYSATRVAEHERITLDSAFDLPVIQALNVLAYLKSYQSYQKKMNE